MGSEANRRSVASGGDGRALVEYLRGGRTCSGVSFQDERLALWAPRVDRPDENVAQCTWTIEIVAGMQSQTGPPCLESLTQPVDEPRANDSTNEREQAQVVQGALEADA